MEEADASIATDWMKKRAAGHWSGGYEVYEGFDDACWILCSAWTHPMLETAFEVLAKRDRSPGHRRIPEGSKEAEFILDGVDLLRLTEYPHGKFLETPRAPWTRVWILDEFKREGVEVTEQIALFAYRWPDTPNLSESLSPVEGGGVGEPGNEILCNRLIEASPQGSDTPIYCFYDILPMMHQEFLNGSELRPLVLTMKLGELSTHLRDQSFVLVPSNIWPEDRSWLVLNEYDTNATLVSGPTSLVDSLRSDPDLEVIPAVDRNP